LKWEIDNDCFHFFCKVQSEVFNINHSKLHLPEDLAQVKDWKACEDNAEVRENWYPVDEYQDGDACLFNATDLCHIGIVVNIKGNYGVLHSDKSHGGIFTAMNIVRCSHRNIKFFRCKK